jgi:hypothetical protein
MAKKLLLADAAGVAKEKLDQSKAEFDGLKGQLIAEARVKKGKEDSVEIVGEKFRALVTFPKKTTFDEEKLEILARNDKNVKQYVVKEIKWGVKDLDKAPEIVQTAIQAAAVTTAGTPSVKLDKI